MKIVKLITAATLLALAQPALAIMCPSNFKQINMGDTLEYVISQCGAPDSQTTAEDSENQPQEWVYFVKADPSGQATMRMTIAFDNKGLVTNMSVNGVGLSWTQACGGATAAVGDTQKSITAACGKPAFVNKAEEKPDPKNTKKITTLIYMNPSKTSLIFDNGVLTTRQ